MGQAVKREPPPRGALGRSTPCHCIGHRASTSTVHGCTDPQICVLTQRGCDEILFPEVLTIKIFFFSFDRANVPSLLVRFRYAFCAASTWSDWCGLALGGFHRLRGVFRPIGLVDDAGQALGALLIGRVGPRRLHRHRCSCNVCEHGRRSVIGDASTRRDLFGRASPSLPWSLSTTPSPSWRSVTYT